MPRRFRLWEKKRGDRRTGSKLVGTAGEALFFAALFMFGAIALTALVSSNLLTPDAARISPWIVWLLGGVLSSLTIAGISGFVYTILMLGTTVERRRALAKKATDIELLTDALPSPREFPNVPRNENLTNSPGIKLAYRLPIARSPSWSLLVLGVFSLLWISLVSILIVVATSKYWAGNTDWYLNLLTVSFAAVGIAAVYYWLRMLLLTTAIGPTSLEVSDLPIFPGGSYDVYLTQAGRLNVKSLSVLLVCDEEATYRQGTDTRTERRRIHEQIVFEASDFEILPEIPYEHLFKLNVPPHAMHSFQSDHNAVQWRLVVRGDLERWSDFERTFHLIVFPSVGAEAAAEANKPTAVRRIMDPLISIQIQGDRPVFCPGDEIDCDYQIDAIDKDELVAVEASVVWVTEGKGGEDLGVHYFERRVPADADGDLRQWRRFRTCLPNSPMSYDGAIIKIRWCVRVRVILKQGKQFFSDHPFRLGQVGG